jgi:uncharacterized phage protein (TIGR02218 family)
MASDMIGSISAVSSASAPLSLDNYLNLEQSIQDGNPIELYRFSKGATIWNYTSTDFIISYLGENYTPEALRRGDIRLDVNTLKTNLEIEVPLTNPLARLFIPEPVEGVIQLTIYRYHNSSFVTYWKGYLRGVKFKTNTAILILGLKTTSLKRFGLMRKYTRNCGIPLYSPLCMILKTDSNFYVDGTVNSVSDTTVDATIFSTKTDGWFLGGIFKTDSDSVLQKIVYHSGTEIRISRSVLALAAGDTFRAWAGCDHLKGTCKTKFSNKLNFGGQPYLPDKNPFVGDPIM